MKPECRQLARQLAANSHSKSHQLRIILSNNITEISELYRDLTIVCCYAWRN